MTEQRSEFYPFTESEFDFDSVILDAGYKLTTDQEEVVIFSKIIVSKGNLAESIKPVIGDFTVAIKRPKRLWKNGKYVICSPYCINFLYAAKPTTMIRRLQWDTFSGASSEHLKSVLNQCEFEAESILNLFLKMDANLLNIQQV